MNKNSHSNLLNRNSLIWNQPQDTGNDLDSNDIRNLAFTLQSCVSRVNSIQSGSDNCWVQFSLANDLLIAFQLDLKK